MVASQLPLAKWKSSFISVGEVLSLLKRGNATNPPPPSNAVTDVELIWGVNKSAEKRILVLPSATVSVL